MKNLQEVGQKAIESINKLRASDAGDLVLGIGDIIEELREQPELYQDKLDHLEGLFKEFAYGEGYKLRDKLAEEKKEDAAKVFSNAPYGMPWGSMGAGALSGVMSTPPISVSGSLQTSPMIGTAMKSVKVGDTAVVSISPVTIDPVHSAVTDALQKSQETAEQIAKKKKNKKFKPAWWKSKV